MSDFISIQVGYISTILVAMTFSTVIGYWLLKNLERKRLASIKRKTISEAINTESPEEDSEKIAKHRAVISVENRFTFMRRLFVPSMFLFTLLIIIFPFLTLYQQPMYPYLLVWQ